MHAQIALSLKGIVVARVSIGVSVIYTETSLKLFNHFTYARFAISSVL